MLPILGVAALAIIGVIGDFFIKLSGHGPKFMEVKWFILGFILYASTAIGWFWVMKYIKLSSLGIVYALTTMLCLVAVGVFYFHERLNAYEILGILMAVVSILLLSRFG